MIWQPALAAFARISTCDATDPLKRPPFEARRQVATAMTWGWTSRKRLIRWSARPGWRIWSNLNSTKGLLRQMASAFSTMAAPSRPEMATHTRGRRRGNRRGPGLKFIAMILGKTGGQKNLVTGQVERAAEPVRDATS